MPLLRAAAAQGVSVTLGGDGGDELFGARAYLASDELAHGRARGALALIGALPGAARASRRERATLFAQLALAGASRTESTQRSSARALRAALRSGCP